MTKFTIVILAAAVSLPCFSRADEKPAEPEPAPARKGYVSALIGDAIVTSTGGGSFLTFAGRAGMGVFEDKSGILSLGAFVNSFSNSATVSGVTSDARITGIMAEIVDRHAFGSPLYFGGRFGIALTNATVTSGSTSISAGSTNFAVAPVVGVELGTSPVVSLVADISWFNRTGGTLTFPTGSKVSYDAASALLLQAGLAVHF